MLNDFQKIRNTKFDFKLQALFLYQSEDLTKHQKLIIFEY